MRICTERLFFGDFLKHVFIIGLEENISPDCRVNEDQFLIEEERCFDVFRCIKMAKEELYLFSVVPRNIEGKVNYNEEVYVFE